MRIIFVAGPAFSGKSIYVHRHFPDAVTVKISTFTKHVYEAESNLEIAQIAENAQLYCREDLQNRIRAASADDTLVLEHHLLKKETRAFFIDAVKAVTDTPVECIVMSPTKEMVERMLNYENQLIQLHLYEKGKMEMPDVSEGFASVTVVHPDYTEEDYEKLYE